MEKIDMKAFNADADEFQKTTAAASEARDKLTEYSQLVMANIREIEVEAQKANAAFVKRKKDELAPFDGLEFDHPNMQVMYSSLRQTAANESECMAAINAIDLRTNTDKAEKAGALLLSGDPTFIPPRV